MTWLDEGLNVWRSRELSHHPPSKSPTIVPPLRATIDFSRPSENPGSPGNHHQPIGSITRHPSWRGASPSRSITCVCTHLWLWYAPEGRHFDSFRRSRIPVKFPTARSVIRGWTRRADMKVAASAPHIPPASATSPAARAASSRRTRPYFRSRAARTARDRCRRWRAERARRWMKSFVARVHRQMTDSLPILIKGVWQLRRNRRGPRTRDRDRARSGSHGRGSLGRIGVEFGRSCRLLGGLVNHCEKEDNESLTNRCQSSNLKPASPSRYFRCRSYKVARRVRRLLTSSVSMSSSSPVRAANVLVELAPRTCSYRCCSERA